MNAINTPNFAHSPAAVIDHRTWYSRRVRVAVVFWELFLAIACIRVIWSWLEDKAWRLGPTPELPFFERLISGLGFLVYSYPDLPESARIVSGNPLLDRLYPYIF